MGKLMAWYQSRYWSLHHAMSIKDLSGDAHTTALIREICMDNLKRRPRGEKLRNIVNLRNGY